MLEITPIGNLLEIDGLSEYLGYYDVGTSAMIDICAELKEMYGKLYTLKNLSIMFTGVVDEQYAELFMHLIRRNRLGEVVHSNTRFNPNSGNRIRAYIWNVDGKALSKWYSNNKG